MSLNLGSILIWPRFFAERNLAVKKKKKTAWFLAVLWDSVLCSEPIMCPGLTRIFMYLFLYLGIGLRAHKQS